MGAAIVPVALADDEQCVSFPLPSHSGELTATRRSYYAVISAGNISFRVALDTGSSDTWLMSSACTSSVCKKVPTYPLAYSSPSFVSINNNETAFAVSYADGTGERMLSVHAWHSVDGTECSCDRLRGDGGDEGTEPHNTKPSHR